VEHWLFGQIVGKAS